MITICTRLACYRNTRGVRFPFWQAFVKGGSGALFYGTTRAEAVGSCVLGSPEFCAPCGRLSIETLADVELTYQSMLAARTAAVAESVAPTATPTPKGGQHAHS